MLVESSKKTNIAKQSLSLFCLVSLRAEKKTNNFIETLSVNELFAQSLSNPAQIR